MLGKRLPRILLVVLTTFTLAITTACTQERESAGQQTAVPTQTASAGTATTPTLVPTAAAEQTKPVSTDTPVPPPLTNTPSSSPKDVYVTSSDGLRVRAGPGLGYDKIKTEPMYSAGTVLGEPTTADGYVWRKVRYADGTEGWSVQDWLAFGTPPSAPVVSTVTPTQHVCDFTKPADLRPATTYDIFGTDSYDTLVCGYVKMVYEEHGGESGRVPLTVPYFVIVDYADPGFIQAVDEGIRTGNGVNQRGPLYYEFNLGCYKDGKIIGDGFSDSSPYIDEATQAAILNSSPDNLVSLVLSFGYHGGRGCDCCNLAHEVRLY